MQEEFVIYCPFIEVRVAEVSCELIDNFGNFPMQILLAINDNYSISEIARGVLVDERVVENTIDELIKKDMLMKQAGAQFKKNPYAPTDNGKKYIAMYEIIRQFREQKTDERFAVNCFTCRMEKIQNQSRIVHSKSQIPSAAPVLKNKIQGSEHLLRTPDYENTHEYMRDYLNLGKVKLTDDDYAYIHFQLSLVNKGTVFFVPYLLSKNFLDSAEKTKEVESVVNVSIPAQLKNNAKQLTPMIQFLSQHHKEAESVVNVSIPVQKANRIFLSNMDLENDAKQLTPMIEFLSQYHEEYLSDIGKKLLEKHNNAVKYTSKCKTLFMNCFTGQKFAESLEQDSKRRVDVKLPERHSFKEGVFPLKKEGMDGFYYRYDSLGVTYITVPIPFTSLQQMGGEKNR